MPSRREPVAWVDRLVASPAVRSAYTSAVVHVVLLTLLALLVAESEPKRPAAVIRLTFGDPDAGAAADAPAAAAPVAIAAVAAAPAAPAAPAAAEPAAATPPLVAVEPVTEPTPAQAAVPVHAVAARGDAVEAAAPEPTADRGDPFAGRRGASRGELVRSRGGSAASEQAVDRGLAWLAAHQGADGSWRFDLANCPCGGACRDPGTVPSTTAATGIALLPFLGAGHTHLEGDYRDTVARGLAALVGRMQVTARGGDLCEGTMYGHGVATLSLAEALGMTRDETLRRPVAAAIRFIATAQDLHTGGWRYLPGQPGDTTVTAWQLAALKSAALAGVEVPSPTIDGVRRFLDRVQARGGEAYGYLGPQAQPCTSAIGLFCRLHTAWEKPEALERGLAVLARPGPAPEAVYRNFYLSQALLQGEHDAWPAWNRRARDQLVAQQARHGHEVGSWFLPDPDTAPGGRLAHTALAVLTLEVYYRLLPLYRPEAVEQGF